MHTFYCMKSCVWYNENLNVIINFFRVFIPQLIKVYGEDNHSRSVWVSRGSTAREVCHMLVQTAHCSDQENWALLELHPILGLGETTRHTSLNAAEGVKTKRNKNVQPSPQSDVWRTTSWSWRFRRPGPSKATQGSSSAKTTPSTSSSGNQWYVSCSRLFIWHVGRRPARLVDVAISEAECKHPYVTPQVSHDSRSVADELKTGSDETSHPEKCSHSAPWRRKTEHDQQVKESNVTVG